MSLNNQLKNQHLMWRAGFGPAVEQLGDLSNYTPKQFYKALVKASEKNRSTLMRPATIWMDCIKELKMPEGCRKRK
jgi:hypothetical protein